MPELPEVETVVRQLRPSLVGVHLLEHRVFDTKLGHLTPLSFAGFKICEVFRVGKHIVIELDRRGGTPRYLVIHLRMSGRLFWVCGFRQRKEIELPRTIHARLPLVHDVSLKPEHIRFVMQGRGGSLVFADPRRFGTVEVFDSTADIGIGGTDPLAPDFSPERLAELLASSKQPLKTWLLRQDRISGIGNIYASEILFRARLSPTRLAGSLDAREIRRLCRAIRTVLNAAVLRSGTTFSDFQAPSGAAGGFQKFLRVYEREGLACRNCSTAIKRIVQAGRSTYFCPSCQKLKEAEA